MLLAISADYADMNRGQLLAKIRELEEVSDINSENSGHVSYVLKQQEFCSKLVDWIEVGNWHREKIVSYYLPCWIKITLQVII